MDTLKNGLRINGKGLSRRLWEDDTLTRCQVTLDRPSKSREGCAYVCPCYAGDYLFVQEKHGLLLPRSLTYKTSLKVAGHSAVDYMEKFNSDLDTCHDLGFKVEEGFRTCQKQCLEDLFRNSTGPRSGLDAQILTCVGNRLRRTVPSAGRNKNKYTLTQKKEKNRGTRGRTFPWVSCHK